MKTISKKTAPYFFMAPYFLLFIAFSLLPIIFTLYVSLNDWNGYKQMKFVGLDNYKRMLENGEFLLSLKNTLIIMLLLIPMQLILAIIIAYMINSKLVRHKSIFKTAIFTPYLTIPIAAGLLWATFFDGSGGTVNYILQDLHIIKEPIDWLLNPMLSKGVIAVIMLWRYLGYSVLFFIAGFVSIPEEHNFWYISLPIIKPIIIYMVITSLIGGFQTFDEPNIIYTQRNYLFGPYSGGPDGTAMTMVMLMSKGAFLNSQYGYGSAVAYGMFLIIAVFSFISLKLMNGRDKDGAF
jgi:ABC-type sugar transport system permease subunit